MSAKHQPTRATETAAASPTAGPGTPSASVDAMAQLKQLGELRDAGILTADEFESKKAELLRRI